MKLQHWRNGEWIEVLTTLESDDRGRSKPNRRQRGRIRPGVTAEQLANREVLKRIPIQRLINAAIEQGFFDRLKIDG